MVTAAELDREIQSSYDLAVTCVDAVGSNATSLTGSALISVRVDDLNDRAPDFRSRVLRARVTENRPAGTTVTVVRATDDDDGRNAEVRYRLLADSGSDFRLDATSGLLTTRRSFDREREETVNITVVAVDRGDPPLSSTADVIVSIVDTDDEVAPMLFTQILKTYQFKTHCEGHVLA